MSMRHINLLSKNMEKIELMEELQVHYKDFVKRMKGRVSYDDYETQSLLEGYTEELASFISKELDKAKIEVLTEIFQTCYQEDSKTRELVEEKLAKLKDKK
jgi:hypothetical protein